MIRPALLALLLAGCGPSLGSIERSCNADARPFVDSWPCVRSNQAAIRGAADVKATYFATGDVVAERIKRGQMTDAEGKLAMSQTLTRLMNEQYGRTAAAGSGPTVYQQVGPGTVVAY